MGRRGVRYSSNWGPPSVLCIWLMDRAYEGNQTRALAAALGFIPVVASSQKRLEPWQYDK